MTQRKIAIGIGVLIALAVLGSLWGTPVSLKDLLVQPIQVLLGSPRQLQVSVLEVSENMTPVEDATRRLLQPLGVVRVIQRFPAPAAAESPADTSQQKSKP